MRRIIFLATALSILYAGLPASASETVQSIEQITGTIRNPEMKKRWESTFKNGTLPPLNKLPIPGEPVSRREAIQVTGGLKVSAKRPEIADTVPADVQIFTKDLNLTGYHGQYRVTSHRDGVISGKIGDSREAFEILYKLPQNKQAGIKISEPNLFLDYQTDLAESSLQRRIVLYNRNTKMPIIASIAEGSEKPYRKTFNEIGLTIRQNVPSDEVDSPPVTVRYDDQTITLSQGEEKSIGKGQKAIRIYLLNSYAYDPRKEALLEGQPYYVKLIIYDSY